MSPPLDEANLRELAAPRVSRWLTAAAIDWAVIVLTFVAAARIDHPAAYVLAVLPIASRQQALGALFHDAAHRLASRDRALNDVLGNLFCAFPLGLTLGGYRRYHFAHHRFLGTDQDPENAHKRLLKQWALPARARRVLPWFVADLLGGGVPHLVAAGKLTRPVSVAETFGLGLEWLVALGVAWRLGVVWIPVLWIAGIVTVFWSGVRLRIWTEHLGTKDTHRIQVPRWLAIAIMPHDIGLHWEHHHFPSVPFYNLARLRALLPANADGAPAVTSLPALATGFLRSAPLGSGEVGETVVPAESASPIRERGRAFAFFAHVAIPLVLGVGVYLACRTKLPRVLAWIPVHAPLAAVVPGAIAGVLPDMAWSYALTAMMAIVWRSGPARARLLWVGGAWMFAASWEVGQYVGIVPGTFAWSDLVTSLAACAMATLLCRDRAPSRPTCEGA